jgi:hypothetical protein
MQIKKFAFNYSKHTVVDENTQEEIDLYYPTIPCVFASEKKKTRMTEGLLDTGSDGIVLPMGAAKYLELELEPKGKPMIVAGGLSVKQYKSKVNLTIGRGGRFVEFKDIEITVPDTEPEKDKSPILIGRDPIFKYYEINFIEAKRKVIMKPFE